MEELVPFIVECKDVGQLEKKGYIIVCAIPTEIGALVTLRVTKKQIENMLKDSNVISADDRTGNTMKRPKKFTWGWIIQGGLFLWAMCLLYRFVDLMIFSST
jgi:hypothetical protein